MQMTDQSAINNSKGIPYERTKYIEIKNYFKRNKEDEVQLNYIPTGQMVVDPLKKTLALDLFKNHVKAWLEEMVM